MVAFYSFSSFYHVTPIHGTASLRKLVPGAILATVLWLLLSVIFSYYVQNLSNFSATFGTLTAGVVLILWTYYSAFVVAIGAAFGGRRVDEEEQEHQERRTGQRRDPMERLRKGLRPEANPRAFWQVIAGALYIAIGIGIVSLGG